MIPKIQVRDMLGEIREIQKVCLFIETNSKEEPFYKIEGLCSNMQFRLLTTYDKDKALKVFMAIQETLLEKQLEKVAV